ncbi:MAG: prolyl oligopeptidase family serine peptidase [Clostridia bacterium]|nr:prolyl oligopeptidase family serine peptidase [Clostridia bacterium]
MKCMEYELNNMKYLVRYPDDYSADRKYPVILCLHGAGTRSSDTEILRNYSLFNEAAKFKNFPFIIIAPLCSENTWFDLWPTLKALVREVAQLPRMDEKRIYLTGNSMGGYAAWQLAMSMPEYFAAVAPICGGGMYWNAGRLMNVPVWAFHGAKDRTVFPEESEKMVSAVNAAGGCAKLTVYPDAEHNSWTPTYSNPELYEWFLSHVNERISSVL